MAFNFYGTYTSGQYNELKKFTKMQMVHIKKRISHLEYLKAKNGTLKMTFDNNNYPTKYEAAKGTYLNKLLIAMEGLGGITTNTFRVSNEVTYLEKGAPLSESNVDYMSGYGSRMSNGKRIHNTRLDFEKGIKVSALKQFMLPAIKRKRELIEYKIKKAIDYSEQLQEQIDLLYAIIDPENARHDARNLDYLLDDLDPVLSRTGDYTVVQNDQDLFGISIGELQDITDFDQDNAKLYDQIGPSSSSENI